VHSFAPCPTATARAGNVIGGGDVSQDRLLPDLLAAMAAGKRPLIRYPDSVRPWQHVLDAVSGYLDLVDALLDGRVTGGAWNFGPDPAGFAAVRDVADRVAELWASGAGWTRDDGPHPPEAALLTLDATKARTQLGWAPRLHLDDALRWTVEWQRAAMNGESVAAVTRRQVDDFACRGPQDVLRPVTTK
jgi:CDP-glucose 4,6-dehydratase